ncbi:hypothetical protein KIW84_012703 [Lathyrus oleraceus]|uniref:Uncharacterized protein n=1 Tax=Pisum sativum TaxID=3888 RepID=A0A9D5GWQ9_PEA|nr:hypothetical protein KIW84_012703 [Pisum sativum]
MPYQNDVGNVKLGGFAPNNKVQGIFFKKDNPGCHISTRGTFDIWHLSISHFSRSGEVIKAWTVEAYPENILNEENSWQIYGAEAVMVHTPTATAIAKSNLVNYFVDIGGIETSCAHDSRGLDNRWTGITFANSCSVNETSAFNTQKLDHNLVYVLSFRELDHQTDHDILHKIPNATRILNQQRSKDHQIRCSKKFQISGFSNKYLMSLMLKFPTIVLVGPFTIGRPTKNPPSQILQMQQQLHNHHASNVARQAESEMGCEDSPSTADGRVNRPTMNIYAQNFAIPMQTSNFALMTTAMSGPGSNGSHSEKQQQHPGSKAGGETSTAFVMPFASINGITAATGLDLSSIVQNHSIMPSPRLSPDDVAKILGIQF